jgi:hypothetical protein
METIVVRETPKHITAKRATISETSTETLLEAVNHVLQHHEHFAFLINEAILGIRAKAAREAEASAATKSKN